MCQKQPLTFMTFFRRANTRSGVPGRERTCRRYRYPREWTKRRTTNSGAVSFDFTAAMIRERSDLVKVSAIVAHLVTMRIPGVPTSLIHRVLYTSKSAFNCAIFPLTENSPSSEMF